MAINRRDIFGEGQDEVFDTSAIGKPINTGVTQPLIKQLARKAGISLEGIGDFTFTPQELQRRQIQRIPTQGSPEALNFIATINAAVQDVRKLRVDRNRLERQPGLFPEERQAIQADIQRISGGNASNSGLAALRDFAQTEGFNLGETFAPLVEEFQQGGIEFTEDEQGNIRTEPGEDLIPTPTPEPEGPLTDEELLGEQQPGTQPTDRDLPPPQEGGPTDQLLPPPQEGEVIPPPDESQVPGQPTPTPGATQPGQQTIIQVPDPQNPGNLINVPVVDTGIPGNIDRQKDQFLLEREGLRQQEQQRRAFESQRAIRGERLGETRSLLEDIAGTQAQQRQAGLLEELQTGGLLQTSELEAAFARESGQQTTAINQAIAAQALADREAEIQGIGGILGRRQAFQTAGLQREFSLEDFERAARVARQTGASVTPQVGGGGSPLSGLLGGAAGGAALGSFIPGIGTGIGAGIGGALGLLTGKKGGGK